MSAIYMCVPERDFVIECIYTIIQYLYNTLYTGVHDRSSIYAPGRLALCYKQLYVKSNGQPGKFLNSSEQTNTGNSVYIGLLSLIPFDSMYTNHPHSELKI